MANPPTLDPRTFLREQLLLTLAELRQAWGFLLLLVEPGRATSPTRDLVNDDRAEALAARGMADQAYRRLNLARGLGALAPAPAAARVAIIDAQVAVYGLTSGVLLYARHVLGHGCVGYRDLVDVVDQLEQLVDDVDDVDALARIDRQLTRANRHARQAAGVLGDPVQPMADRCPSCRRKSLALHYDPEDMHRVADGLEPRYPSLWWVECVSTSCRCSGVGCPCGRPADEGRRHAWAYGNLAELWRAADAAAPPRRRIRSASAGNGWGVIGA